MTPRQQAAAISEAIGERVDFVELSRAQAHERMTQFMPADVVETTLSILGDPTVGEQTVSPEVERIGGRAPKTFAEWVAGHAAVFRS